MDADPRDARVRELEAQVERLTLENAQLRQTIEDLLKRLEELERAAHRQAAPFRRPESKRKPPETHRKAGRPAGHAPSWRPRPERIDEEIVVPLPRDAAGGFCCPACQKQVNGAAPCEQFIEDLPPIRPHVTRLVTWVADCPTCGEVRSTHPLQVSTAGGAAGTHLGTRALSLAAWLNKHLGLTMRKTCGVLKALGGLRLSPGGLSQALNRVADRSAGALDELWQTLRASPVAHADETSWWVGGKPHWLWVFTTPRETLYRIQAGRGRDVVLDTLGTNFAGVLVSDCLASYENLPYTMHKCYAHHLKAISEARDRAPPENHPDFDELITMLKSAMLLKTLRPEMTPADFAARRAALEQTADRLLTARTGAVAKVAQRLHKRRKHLFTFLDHDAVEATNNRAERALRPAVIARKLSCGNKTQRGVRTWETLASLAASCAQQDRDFLEFLRPKLQIVPVALGR